MNNNDWSCSLGVHYILPKGNKYKRIRLQKIVSNVCLLELICTKSKLFACYTCTSAWTMCIDIWEWLENQFCKTLVSGLNENANLSQNQFIIWNTAGWIKVCSKAWKFFLKLKKHFWEKLTGRRHALPGTLILTREVLENPWQVPILNSLKNVAETLLW